MAAPRIIVGFDGSDGSRAALRWAIELAVLDGSTVDAVAVWSVPVLPVSPWAPMPVAVDNEATRLAHEERLAQQVEDVRATVPHAPPVALRAVSGFSGPTLVEQAVGERCLVVGRRGHGGFAELLLGSVADHCLHHATTPVALVPPGGSALPDAVVVGVDGSDHASDALRWGAEEADRLSKPLVALYAWSWLDQPAEFDPGFDAAAAREFAVEQVERTLGERRTEVVVVNDLPARALLERSAAGDLVVVGRRGLGPIREAVLGSVSRGLAHHATGAVVVVPRP